MAYYDQFTKKPRNPRDDWRDDEETLRPERDGEQNRRPYGGRPNNGERRPYGERPNNGERRAYGERPNNGERRPYGERPMTPPAPQEEETNNLLVGRNPIREALKAGRDMEKLLVAKGELIGSAREIVAMAPGHQGLIAVVSAYAYQTVDDMLALAKARGEAPFLVILDGVTDPHNLGAIIRSAECAGAHGVIIPERRAVGLTPAAVKASAGAVEYLPVAREVNLTRTIERLKKEGIWIYGTAMNGEDYRKVDFSGPKALVIGSEGEGMSRLVGESCDKVVTLPMKGKIESLNASVAAGILLYAMMDAK